jgi:exo-poly-alpha-galacturonosidase
MKLKTSSIVNLLMVFMLAEGASAGGKKYVITDFGAKGGAKTVNTFGIQAAIDRCASEGGGTVVVPRDTFLTGAIFLRQGVDLIVEKNGVLKGTADPGDYPRIWTRWEGIEREWTCALINGDSLDHVQLGGEGTIDGSGDLWLRSQSSIRNREGSANQASEPPRRLGKPRLICFQNCRNVRISGLTLRNQAVWCLHILYCEDVTAEGLAIRADHNIPSSDGIDVDSSRRVRIRGCDIDVNDDCISIKSGRDKDGLRVNRPSEEILIEKCRFGYGHGGAAMGSETSGGIRNVEVRDCTAEAGNWAPIRFKTQPSRGGIVENIVYRNIRLNGVRRAFEFNMEWRMVPPILPPAEVLPVVRNIKIVRVTGSAESGGLIHGLKDSPIENVTFEDCFISAQKGLVLENTRDIDLSGLKMDVKEGESIIGTGKSGGTKY